MAETRHTFTASCPLIVESTREIDAGERKNLYLLGLRIPLSLSGAKDCEIAAYEREPLTLLGTELPVWTETLRCAELQPVTVEFTEEEARQRAYEKVRLLEENYLGETGILLSETVSYTLAVSYTHLDVYKRQVTAANCCTLYGLCAGRFHGGNAGGRTDAGRKV